MHRVDEALPQDEVLDLSLLLLLERLVNLSSLIILGVDHLISSIQLLQTLFVVGKVFPLGVLLHLALGSVDEVRADQNPDYVSHEATNTAQFQVATVEHVDVDKAEQGDHKEHLSSLAHQFLVRKEKGIMQAPSRAIGQVSVVGLVGSSALSPYFDQHYQ